MRFWYPTPTAHAAKGQKTPYAQGGTGLAAFVANLYPTPTAADARCHNKYGRGNDTLTTAVKRMYPTPRAGGQDNAGGGNSRRTAKAAGTYFGRTLNPQFVEWLMGFPIGWTDCDVSATR